MDSKTSRCKKISQDINYACHIAYTSALCTLYVSHKRAPVLLFQKFVYCRPVFVIFFDTYNLQQKNRVTIPPNMVWPWSGDVVLVSSDTVPPVSVSRTRLLCRWNFCDRLKPCPHPWL